MACRGLAVDGGVVDAGHVAEALGREAVREAQERGRGWVRYASVCPVPQPVPATTPGYFAPHLTADGLTSSGRDGEAGSACSTGRHVRHMPVLTRLMSCWEAGELVRRARCVGWEGANGMAGFGRVAKSNAWQASHVVPVWMWSGVLLCGSQGRGPGGTEEPAWQGCGEGVGDGGGGAGGHGRGESRIEMCGTWRGQARAVPCGSPAVRLCPTLAELGGGVGHVSLRGRWGGGRGRGVTGSVRL